MCDDDSLTDASWSLVFSILNGLRVELGIKMVGFVGRK